MKVIAMVRAAVRSFLCYLFGLVGFWKYKSDKKDKSIQTHKIMYPVFLKLEFDRFDEYLNILDKELNRRSQKLSTKIDGADEYLNRVGNSVEARNELINLKVEDERVISFSNLLRQSFLTSLYSFMELWLIRECYVDSKSRCDGEYNKLGRNKGIKEAKEYFFKVMKSDYPFGSSTDWLWITKFKLLRDCIVHRQGSLTGFSDYPVDNTLAKFVDDEVTLSLFGINDNQIFIEHDFCLKALQIVQRFMVDLLVP